MDRFAAATTPSRTERFARGGLERDGDHKVRGVRGSRARSTTSAACPIATPFAEISVSPSLGSKPDRRRSRRGGAPRRPASVPPEVRLALADGDQRDRRHVHQVGRADRSPIAGTTGGHRRSASRQRSAPPATRPTRRARCPRAGLHGRADDRGPAAVRCRRVNANGPRLLRRLEDLERDRARCACGRGRCSDHQYEPLAVDQAVDDGAPIRLPFGRPGPIETRAPRARSSTNCPGSSRRLSRPRCRGPR